MKTRLEYHLRKFKKRYQFKQIGNNPNYGTILIDGYVFRVSFDLRSIVGRWLDYEPSVLSILQPGNIIIVPRADLLQKQKSLYAGLCHEIGHFILYQYDDDFNDLQLEILCDLNAYIHCGFKNAKNIVKYPLNHRYNYMIAMLVPAAYDVVNNFFDGKYEPLKLNYRTHNVKNRGKYYSKLRLYVRNKKFESIFRVDFLKCRDTCTRSIGLVDRIKRPYIIDAMKYRERIEIEDICDRVGSIYNESNHVRDYIGFDIDKYVLNMMYPYVYK